MHLSEKGEQQALIHIEAFEKRIEEELPYCAILTKILENL